MRRYSIWLYAGCIFQAHTVFASFEFDSLYLDCGIYMFALENTIGTKAESWGARENHFVRAYRSYYFKHNRVIEYRSPNSFDNKATISPSEISFDTSGLTQYIDRTTGILSEWSNQGDYFARGKKPIGKCEKSSELSIKRRIEEHNDWARNRSTKF